MTDERVDPPGESQRQRRREKRDVHGWCILDKPMGITSTHAVAVVKRLYGAKRAGHAGTLDPLASGILPVALGEATKTVPFVMEGRKIYRFTVRWGEERDTDDSEGRITNETAERPQADQLRALLPRFTGTIEQVPPRFSAIKIDGERAYDLAREGEAVEMVPRPVEIHRLELVETPDADHSVFIAECSKGTYVRALARDMGRALGSFGHVSALRRTGVASFREEHAVPLDKLQATAPEGDDVGPLVALLQPVAAGVQTIPSVSVSRADAARLVRGQPALLRGRDAPVLMGLVVAVFTHGDLIALADAEQNELRPRRIFNLGGPGAVTPR